MEDPLHLSFETGCVHVRVISSQISNSWSQFVRAGYKMSESEKKEGIESYKTYKNVKKDKEEGEMGKTEMMQ